MMDIQEIENAIRKEFFRACELHPRPYNSPHEGYAVMKEEVDELWDAVKANNTKHAIDEAVQVAVTAMRFIHSLSGNDFHR